MKRGKVTELRRGSVLSLLGPIPSTEDSGRPTLNLSALWKNTTYYPINQPFKTIQKIKKWATTQQKNENRKCKWSLNMEKYKSLNTTASSVFPEKCKWELYWDALYTCQAGRNPHSWLYLLVTRLGHAVMYGAGRKTISTPMLEENCAKSAKMTNVSPYWS